MACDAYKAVIIANDLRKVLILKNLWSKTNQIKVPLLILSHWYLATDTDTELLVLWYWSTTDRNTAIFTYHWISVFILYSACCEMVDISTGSLVGICRTDYRDTDLWHRDINIESKVVFRHIFPLVSGLHSLKVITWVSSTWQQIKGIQVSKNIYDIIHSREISPISIR